MLCCSPKHHKHCAELEVDHIKLIHLPLKRLVRSLKDVCTYLHCHVTCSIVSELELQNVPSSHWFGLNFDTDQFVVRIMVEFLNCNHNSLWSSVLFSVFKEGMSWMYVISFFPSHNVFWFFRII